jgi:hypothetical protein
VPVELLEAGAEPRAPLRYRLGDQRDTFLLELATQLRLAIGDLAPPAPTPSVRITIEVRAAQAQRRVALEGTIVKVEIPEEPGVPAAVVTAVRADLERLTGITWKAEFTDTGNPELLALEAPADANAQLVTTLSRIRESLRRLLPPLPDAPVGKNARWRVRGAATVGPVHIDETAIYKLGAGDGRTSLQVTLGMAAADQPLVMPGTPPGAALALTSFEGGGKGQIELGLDHIVQPSTLRWAASGKGTAQPAGEPLSPISLGLEASAVVRRP